MNDWDQNLRLAKVPPGLPDAPGAKRQTIEPPTPKDRSGWVAWLIFWAFMAIGLIAFITALQGGR